MTLLFEIFLKRGPFKSFIEFVTLLLGSAVKNLLANAGDLGVTGSIPGSEGSPEGNSNPFQYLAWKIPWRSLAGYSPWAHKESDTT